MFGLKKKVAAVEDGIYVPVSGSFIPLEEVSDDVFANKMLGDGFAIQPNDDLVVAPISGEITMIQPHAVGIKRKDGLEFLIHMGIDTVQLLGKPFTIHVQVGDQVQAGELMAHVDWQQIEEADLMSTTLIVITNTVTHLEKLEISDEIGLLTTGMLIGRASAKR